MTTSTPQLTSLEWALHYARQGIPVGPQYSLAPDGRCTCTKGAGCRKPGKHPNGRIIGQNEDGESGSTLYTTDPETIHAWWSKDPDAPIGADTERAGIVDVAPDSWQWSNEFRKRGLPETAHFRSSYTGGHEHHWYRRPEDCPPARITHTGEYDIMARGNTVLPAAARGTGVPREWLTPGLPDLNGALPDAPPWVVAMLREAAADEVEEAARRSDHTWDGPTPPIDPIVKGCAWLRHCRDDAKTIGEPEWYAMLSIVGRCADGVQLAHEWSKPYPDYTYGETAAKLKHAFADAGPRTCRSIRTQLGGEMYCQVCPHWGEVTSPIVLGQARGTLTIRNSGESVNSGSTLGQEEWTEPTLFHAIARPPFPADALAPWQRDFVEAEAEATQSPRDLGAMLALSATAAAVAAKIEVRVRAGWVEPLNLYVATALPPAERKSAVFSAMTAPIESYERRIVQETAPEIAEVQMRYEVAKASLQHAQTTAAKAKPEEQGQLIERAAELARELATMKVPARPRLIADDVSPEKLASLLAEQQGRIAIMSPEGDIFDLMAGRYSANGTPNFGVFLKGHAGDSLRVDRVGRPAEFVKKPALTLGLAVQPEVLAGLASKPGFRGRGLLGRFCYALPRSALGGRTIKPPPVPDAIAARYAAGLTTLLRLPFGTDTDGNPAAHTLSLTTEAEATLEQFAAWVEPQLGEFGDLGGITDWGGKLVGAVVRIAGVLHLADHADHPAPWTLTIDAAVIGRAVQIGQYLIPHAQAVFALMGADPGVEDAKYILRWIERTEVTTFTRRDVWQSCRGRFKRVEDLDAPLRILTDHGYIRPQPQPPRTGPGRPPSPAYEVNPLEGSQNSHNTQNSTDGVHATGQSGNFEYSVNSGNRSRLEDVRACQECGVVLDGDDPCVDCVGPEPLNDHEPDRDAEAGESPRCPNCGGPGSARNDGRCYGCIEGDA